MTKVSFSRNIWRFQAVNKWNFSEICPHRGTSSSCCSSGSISCSSMIHPRIQNKPLLAAACLHSERVVLSTPNIIELKLVWIFTKLTQKKKTSLQGKKDSKVGWKQTFFYQIKELCRVKQRGDPNPSSPVTNTQPEASRPKETTRAKTKRNLCEKTSQCCRDATDAETFNPNKDTTH